MRFAKNYDIEKKNRMKLLGINRMKFAGSKESCSRGGLYKQKNFFWRQFICFYFMSGYWRKVFIGKNWKVC